MSSKKTLVRSALRADDSTGWIKTSKSVVDSPILPRLMVRFVYLSEAHGVSKSREGFIKDLRVDRSERARSLYKKFELDGAVRLRAFSSPDDLGQALKSEGLSDNSFVQCHDEFAFFLFSGHAAITKRVGELPEFKKGAKRKSGSKRQSKSEFYRLDSLFRHLRNSLAHGQCMRIENAEGEAVWALQDSNARGIVTSRLLLREATLSEWIELVNKRDRRNA